MRQQNGKPIFPVRKTVTIRQNFYEIFNADLAASIVHHQKRTTAAAIFYDVNVEIGSIFYDVISATGVDVNLAGNT